MKELGQKSDLRGLIQTVGHLAVLGLTGSCAWLAADRLAWPWVALFLFCHGTAYCFLLNGLHELVHRTVFRANWLNQVFIRVYSFLFGFGFNPFFYWESHTEHHKYTLHPPDDLELELPVPMSLKYFLIHCIVDPVGFVKFLGKILRISCGHFKGEWELALFPKSEPAKRRPVIWWSRTLLIGHGLLVGISFYLGYWMLPILITFAPYYGRVIAELVNQPQHIGLADNVPDYRLCCRTVTHNRFLEFLSWYMTYHTEHHMYATVPCYNLPKLHRMIKHDMPYCPNGILSAWTQIIKILKKQKTNPEYQHIAELPKQHNMM